MHVNRQFPLLFLVLVMIAWLLVNPPASGLSAVPMSEARVTRVINHVQLSHSTRAPQRASLNDIVDQETVVRTGRESHAELTFSDETVARLAASTAFNFKEGTRDLNLGEGAVLIQVPKSANGAKIHAGTMAAAITGTTVMIEYHPGACKFLVLQGTGRLYRPGHPGDSVLVGPGQMVIGNPNAAVSDPVNFDIARFLKTSRFITDFQPLPSEKLIVAESHKQQQEKSKKSLIETNLVIFGGGTQVSLIGQVSATKHAAPNSSPAAPRASQ